MVLSSSSWTVTTSGVKSMTLIRSSMDCTTTGTDFGPDPGSMPDRSTVAVKVELIARAPDGDT